MKINLYIERIVLDGTTLSSSQSHSLRFGMERELSRLLAEETVLPTPAQGVSLSYILTKYIQPDATDPVQTGKQIAHTVFDGICQEFRPQPEAKI